MRPIDEARARIGYQPLFSPPSCSVLPPYGEAYVVAFQPGSTGPTGTFPACGASASSTPCYEPDVLSTPGAMNFETVKGGSLTLSSFNADGMPSGQMNTNEGIVPLVVKNRP